MGNCLDIPPPPPKSRHVYYNGVRYVVVRRKLPYASGSLAVIPCGYPDYQRRAAFGGFRPVVFPPFSGHAYAYPLEPAAITPVYYTDYSYIPSSIYGYHNNTVQRSQKSHRERTKKSPKEDVVTKQDLDIKCDTDAPCYTDGPSNGVISLDKIKPVTLATAFNRSWTEGRDAQDDVCQPDIRTSLVGATSITVVRRMSSQPSICEPIREEVISITTDFASENALSETDVTYEEQQIDLLNGTESTAEYFLPEHVGEPDKQSTVADDATRTSAAPEWMNSPNYVHTPSDVVLSYHSSDVEAMRKIKHKLETAGVRTVVSYPTDGPRQDVLTAWLMFPQAVADAKVMIVLLSHHSVTDRHIKDEVCLAQVTETLIYPVALENCPDLLIAMDAGLKLQVACYKWTELGGGINSDFALALMVRRVKEDLAFISSYYVTKEDCAETSEQVATRWKLFCNRQTQKMIKFGCHMTAAQYWDKHYGSDVDSVLWERFHEDLFKEYRNLIKGAVDGAFSQNFRESLKREIEVNSDEKVWKTQFVEFCNKLDTDQDVWERVYCVAREAQALQEVLDVASTVRAIAIENICKFSNSNAIVALRQLMTDHNPNIRAATTLSLSRSLQVGDDVTFAAIMAALDDKDELVRETGCIALGHLQAKKAVEKLSNICHKDPKARVREAADLALKEIRGH